jgi:hypothetical protein
MTMPDSKIIGLINGISKDNALVYGSTQIEMIDKSPDGNGIAIYFAGQSDPAIIPISSFNLCLKTHMI